MEHRSFPSIEQFRNVIRNVKEHTKWSGTDENGCAVFDRTKPMPKLVYRGTVKLHGTNAAICFTKDETSFQSRSNIITPENDNAGFATYMQDKADALRKFFVFGEDARIDIFGEWCGKSIQKGVAISQLDKMFVIFAIRVNDVWLDMECEYKVSDPANRIFNIMDFPTYQCMIDFNRPEDIQNTLITHTEAVEQECPVGKHFGVSGVGEGVVWQSIDPMYWSPKFTFKVKGEKHSASKVKTLAAVDVEKLESLRELIDSVVSENRLNQGIDYLKEQGLEPIDKNTGIFLKWVVSDVIKEEKDTIDASGLDPKSVNAAASKAAREWYFKNLT